MFDGTLNGSLLNTFAVNGAAYNVEVSGIDVSHTSGELNLTRRQSIKVQDIAAANGTFNLSKKVSVSGYAFARAVSTFQATRRVSARAIDSTSAQSGVLITRRRSIAFKDKSLSISKATVNRRVSIKCLDIAKTRNDKSHFIRRRSVSSQTIELSLSRANLRKSSRIGGIGITTSLQQATANRRVSAVSSVIEKSKQELRATRRVRLSICDTTKMLGRIKLPHLRFKAIDDYRSLKNTKDIRRIMVRRSNDQFFVPADKRSAAVFRSNRSIAVPNFEEGK